MSFFAVTEFVIGLISLPSNISAQTQENKELKWKSNLNLVFSLFEGLQLHDKKS